jgi:hypothetical protein
VLLVHKVIQEILDLLIQPWAWVAVAEQVELEVNLLTVDPQAQEAQGAPV